MIPSNRQIYYRFRVLNRIRRNFSFGLSRRTFSRLSSTLPYSTEKGSINFWESNKTFMFLSENFLPEINQNVENFLVFHLFSVMKQFSVLYEGGAGNFYFLINAEPWIIDTKLLLSRNACEDIINLIKEHVRTFLFLTVFGKFKSPFDRFSRGFSTQRKM